jgi:hypothetical protein
VRKNAKPINSASGARSERMYEISHPVARQRGFDDHACVLMTVVNQCLVKAGSAAKSTVCVADYRFDFV